MSRKFIASLASVAVLAGQAALPVRAAPLEPAGSIAMPGVKGRIDHFTVDVEGRRLFVAALGNDTVEVFDISGNRHLRSIGGFGEPQGLLYVHASHLLFVANGTADRVDLLDAESYKTLKRVDKLPDADNLRLDSAGHVVAGYGAGALRFMDQANGEKLKDIPVSGHPESFQLERAGARAFVNIRNARHVDVVDREKGAVVAKWPLDGARAHYPMALDEEGKRLFVGARVPPTLLVYDTASGKIASKSTICGDSDDIFYDPARKRLYVVCGEGKVDVLAQAADGRLTREAVLETSQGARTGLFVPELNRLFIAAPARGTSPARLLLYDAR
jgi:DNA-binding beta-propeller fold protein YncE